MRIRKNVATSEWTLNVLNNFYCYWEEIMIFETVCIHNLYHKR